MLRHPQKYCFETFCRKSNPRHSCSFTLEYCHSVHHLFVWFPSHSSVQKSQRPVSGAQSAAPIAQDWLLQATFLPPGLQVRGRQHQAAGLPLCCCVLPDLVLGTRLLCRNTSFLLQQAFLQHGPTIYYSLQSFLLHASD